MSLHTREKGVVRSSASRGPAGRLARRFGDTNPSSKRARMRTWKRTRAIRQVVIHVNVGPEIPGKSAEALAKYLDGIVGGYHHVHDDDSSLRLVGDDICVAGAKGGDCNEVALHHCIIGRADQTAAQWGDEFSAAAMQRCATHVAEDCRYHAIRPERITGSEIVNPTVSGLCGHGDISHAWNVRGGHSDPGPNFPWDQFCTQVRGYLITAPVPSTSEEDDVKGAQTIVRTRSGAGYYIVGADGGVFAYGDAQFYGSMGGQAMNAPIVGMELTSSGAGYWLLGQDGGIFAFGDAQFYGAPTGQVQ